MSAQIVKPARIEFGELLRFYRSSRNLPQRRVADMIGGSVSDVEAYETGRIVPEGRAWDKYKSIVDRRLAQPMIVALRLRALSEVQAERNLITKSMEHRMATTNGTNGHSKHTSKIEAPLAHKPFSGLADVKLADAPSAIIPAADARTVRPGEAVTYHNEPTEAAPDVKPYDAEHAARTKEALAKLPKGWKQTEQINKRREFALRLIRQRPSIRDNGADGLQEALRKTFGVGLSEPFVRELRAQVRREAECEHKPAASERQSIPKIDTEAPIGHAAPPIASTPPAPAPHNPEEDLATAVELILESLPNLRTFTITVDDTGEASVAYTMREVKVIETGGSLKVKR